MIGVCIRLIVLVAGETTEDGEITRIDVTIHARIPLIPMLTGIDGEVIVVMVEVGIAPIVRVVAEGAGRWETVTGVLLLIVRLMAREAILIVRGTE